MPGRGRLARVAAAAAGVHEVVVPVDAVGDGDEGAQGEEDQFLAELLAVEELNPDARKICKENILNKELSNNTKKYCLNIFLTIR